MRTALARWVRDADALRHTQEFGFSEVPLPLSYLPNRIDDFYISLVGELFDRMKEPYGDSSDWAHLGNAFAQMGTATTNDNLVGDFGIDRSEAALYAAAAFYFGGFPASAYLALKTIDASEMSETFQACFELLTRPSKTLSHSVTSLIEALRHGQMSYIYEWQRYAAGQERGVIALGPGPWVEWRLFRRMLDQFAVTNIRAVLPYGASDFWNPMVASLLDRKPPIWDFFPSQIEAVKGGLFESSETYSLQMPTGAGKTALSETLLYYHLKQHPENVAVLLVPYRSLASELRQSLVRRMNEMGLPARCAYGGTVPTGDEVRSLENVRVMVATPESLSGVLSADPLFFHRISLVICDEGHLLDGRGRGVGLELLLARMLTRPSGSPRFVFVSAIVPNIEEINAWLGGTSNSVIRSDYRPAIAEFALLDPCGTGVGTIVDLVMHPQEDETLQYAIHGFLKAKDFRYINSETGRINTYGFSSVKTQTIATARKALAMGAVAVFAANKRGDQGAVGLAKEIISQLRLPLPLPKPKHFTDNPRSLAAAIEHLKQEYGDEWEGTQALKEGVVLHHGDIPQESREVLERLVRDGMVNLVICTSTLAEGVNLPIRTLILYSVKRGNSQGKTTNLLTRDIKNLAGRAGRAGASTKGLVICANPGHWSLVNHVAQMEPGEDVKGALRSLMETLLRFLNQQGIQLTNEFMEANPPLHTLIDGIDSTLIDLAVEELGEDGLVQAAQAIADQTFASQQARPESKELVRQVFSLRARRVAAIQQAGRLNWVREIGAKARLIESVESGLLPLHDHWDAFISPMDPHLLESFLTWAWQQPDMIRSLKEAYRDNTPSKDQFTELLLAWLQGRPLVEIADLAELSVGDMLGVHSKVITYTLQVAVEQAVAVLEKLISEADSSLSKAVKDFPEHLRFGVPTEAGIALAQGGVTHRRAAVELGSMLQTDDPSSTQNKIALFSAARLMLSNKGRWLPILGELVYDRTVSDLTSLSANNQ